MSTGAKVAIGCGIAVVLAGIVAMVAIGGAAWWLKGKAEQIASWKAGDYHFSAFDSDDLRIRLYGEAAVATGRIVEKGEMKGRDISGRHRFTRVFVKRQGRWQMVATQVTPIAEAHP